MTDWRPVREAVPDGTICKVRMRDSLGAYDVPGKYFLHDDGHWYRIDPPTQIKGMVAKWQPAAG